MRRFCIIIAFNIYICNLSAQTFSSQESFIPPAPEAAAFGKYGDVPVSHYSGVPSINIPLYSVKARDIDLPLSLSYHASGNRVSDEASWVGLGWTLNAGGMITRVIRGYDDFAQYETKCEPPFSYSQLGENLKTPDDFSSGESPYDYLGTGIEYYFNKTSANTPGDGDEFCEQLFNDNGQKFDTEPDLFTFQAGAYSGKFVLNQQLECIPLDAHNVRIELVELPGNVGFQIITPDGMKYYFGLESITRQKTYSISGSYIFDEDNPNGTSPMGCTFPSEHVSTWLLDKIVSYNQDSLVFSYEKNSSNKIKPIMGCTGGQDMVLFTCGGNLTTKNNLPCSYFESPVNHDKEILNKNEIWYDQVYLKEISHRYGKVEFISSNNRDDLENGKRLDSIKIYRNSSLYKVFALNYNYFVSPAVPTENRWDTRPELNIGLDFNANHKRLKLLSVQDVGLGSSNAIPPHTFEYDPTPLPPKTSFSVDYWGFANGPEGNNYNTSFIGEQGIEYYDCYSTKRYVQVPGAVKNPNEKFTKAGVLQKVIYPTGGYTSLKYESNEYSNLRVPFVRNGLGKANLSFISQPGETGKYQQFVITDERPDNNVNVEFNLVWSLAHANCLNLCGQGSSNCINDQLTGGIGFVIKILDGEANLIKEWYYNESEVAIENVYCPSSFNFELQDVLTLIPGIYQLEIIPSCASFGNVMPENILCLMADLSWDKYKAVEFLTGPGVRVKETIDFDPIEGNAQVKTYEYGPGILFNEPHNYSIATIKSAQGPCGGLVTENTHSVLKLTSSSHLPLSNNYAGNYIGYDQVTTHYADNGKIERTFRNFEENNLLTEPLATGLPIFYNMGNGQLKLEVVYREDGSKVKETTNSYAPLDINKFNWIWGYKIHDIAHWNITGYPNLTCDLAYELKLFFYATVPQWHKLASKHEKFYDDNGLDAVNKITTYEYNDSGTDPNYLISSEQFNNSNGDVNRMEYKYPVDFGYTFMTDPGIHYISPVIEQTRKVNGIVVSGSRTTYNSNISGCSGCIVPHEIYIREGSIWDLQGTFVNYTSDAYPATYDRNHYIPDIEYQWNNGLLESQTYSEFVWQYQYYPNRNLKKHIQVDGQEVDYVFDDHQRLTNITERLGNKESKITYTLGGPNIIANSIEYSDAPTQTVEKHFNGLGHYLHSLSLSYAPGGGDVITAGGTLDNMWRRDKEVFLPGTYLQNSYQKSPLTKLVEIAYPDKSKVSTTYMTSNGYFVTTTYDENGHPTTTKTDLLDRTTEVVNALDGTTSYQYNIYDNVTLITTPASNQYSYTYDPQQRMDSKSVPGGGTSTYSYYSTDLVNEITDANNKITKFTYDEYDRIISNTIDGVSIVNSYGTGFTVDKLESTSTGVFGGLPLSASFIYDDYGRIDSKSCTTILGADEYSYDYDMADRTLYRHRNHLSSLNIIENMEYDRWGRLEKHFHKIGGGPEVTIQSNTWNGRDELLGRKYYSPSGHALQSMDYAYEIRGWLRSINHFVDSDTLVDICIPPDTLDTYEIIYRPKSTTDTIATIDEILKIRWGRAINIEDYDPCMTMVCDTLPCSQAEIINQSYSITNILRITDSALLRREPIACEGESIKLLDKVDLEEVGTNTFLYRVRFCTGDEMYVLQDYLSLIVGSYEILQEIAITSPTQTLTVLDGTVQLTLPLTELLARVLRGETPDINNYQDCEPSDCEKTPPTCNSSDLQAQKHYLDSLEGLIDSIDVSTLSFPVTLYRVLLCDGTELYLMADELNALPGDFTILQQTLVESDTTFLKTSIDHEGQLDYKDLFAQQLFYNKSNDVLRGKARKNGDISYQLWQSVGRQIMGYGYWYDEINRLKKATYGEYVDNKLMRTRRYDVYGDENEQIRYDADGNIESLIRHGPDLCTNGALYQVIDDLKFTINQNRMTAVAELSNKQGYHPGPGGAFNYDAAGNMTSVGNKGSTVVFNGLNLPQSATFTVGASMVWTYAADGRKLEHIGPDGTRQHADGIEVRDGKKFIYFPDGRAYLNDDQSAWVYEYALKDHLGNARVVIADINLNGTIDTHPDSLEILQENHYYPFGMNHEGEWIRQLDPINSYMYNGKEFTEDSLDVDGDGRLEMALDWYDYGARFYDPSIGRFTGVDPSSELIPSLSVFHYGDNNPISNVDPDGRSFFRSSYLNSRGGHWSDILGPTFEEQRDKEELAKAEEPPPVTLYLANQTSLSTSQILQIIDISSNIFYSQGVTNLFHYKLISPTNFKNLKISSLDPKLAWRFISSPSITYASGGNTLFYEKDFGSTQDIYNSYINIHTSTRKNGTFDLKKIGYVLAHETLHGLLAKSSYYLTRRRYDINNSSDLRGHFNQLPNLIFDGKGNKSSNYILSEHLARLKAYRIALQKE